MTTTTDVPAYGATALAVIGFHTGIAYETYSHWTSQVSKDRVSFADGIAPHQALSARGPAHGAGHERHRRPGDHR